MKKGGGRGKRNKGYISIFYLAERGLGDSEKKVILSFSN